MFKVGSLVETKHYLKRGPMEIGAFTLFLVTEIPEDNDTFVLCEPMYDVHKKKCGVDNINYGRLPIATEDLQYYFKGEAGNLLNDILGFSDRTFYSSSSTVRIPFDKLKEVIFNNKNFSHEDKIRRMYD